MASTSVPLKMDARDRESYIDLTRVLSPPTSLYSPHKVAWVFSSVGIVRA